MDLLTALFILIIIGMICFTMFKVFKNRSGFKDFRPQTLKETVEERINPMLKLKEEKLKGGKLYIGFNTRLDILSYAIGECSFQEGIFDPNTRTFTVPETDDTKGNKTKFLFVKTKSTNFIFRLFGLQSKLFILDFENISEFKLDLANKIIFIPPTSVPYSYAGQWVFSDRGIEICNQLSIMRLLEQSQMYIENIPDKYSHMEMAQAQKERTARVVEELEKRKYDDIKKGTDTTVT